jgi:hypothetical protein
MLRFGSCPTSPCGTGRTGAGAGTGSWLWPSSPHPMGGQDAWSQRNTLNMEALTQRGVDCRTLPCADHVLGTMLWDISSNVAERPRISKKTRPANTRRAMGAQATTAQIDMAIESVREPRVQDWHSLAESVRERS